MSWARKNNSRKKSRCKVRDCERDPLKSLHKLPTENLTLRKKWIERLKLDVFSDPFYICGDHFTKNDYVKGIKRKRLGTYAVPSVNVPSMDESSVEEECLSEELLPTQQKLWDEDCVIQTSTEEEICPSVDKEWLMESSVMDDKGLNCSLDRELVAEMPDEEAICPSVDKEWLMKSSVMDEGLNCSVDKELAGMPAEEEICPLSSVDKEWLMESEDNGLNCSVDGESIDSLMDESCLEDELIIHLEVTEEEFISEYANNCFAECESTAIKYHDSLNEKTFKDKSVQANLEYDELIKPWTLLDVLHTNSDLQSWTGIPSFVTLENIVKCVKSLKSAQAQLLKFKATPKLLTVFVMAKIKTNLSYKQLACLFSFTPRTLAKYFDGYIPILKAVLEPAIFWPSKEQIYNNLPLCFKPSFKDCVILMDCTESPIENLKSLESRIKTYSFYKGCNTSKINITSTPSGLVVHVTKAWGGKASDKFIVLKELILENLSANDGCMVDKGYAIEKETSDKGIKLYRPPILDQPQHSKPDAVYNTLVATSRIHIERVIQRIKIFNLFRSKLNKSMLKNIDNLVFIACAITNLSAPILSKDKF